MRHTRALLSLVIAASFSAFAGELAPPHQLGKHMTFPVDATSTLDNLGRSIIVNCQTDDTRVKEACIARIESRIASCDRGDRKIFHDIDQYNEVARTFLRCVFPLPVCKGVEIRSERENRRFCSKQG
jgi:hypothetical protein